MPSPRSLVPLALVALLVAGAVLWLDPLATTVGEDAPDRARAEALAVLAGEPAGSVPVPADAAAASSSRAGRSPARLSASGAPGDGPGTAGAAPGQASPREAGAPAGRMAVTTNGAGARKDRTWSGQVRSSDRGEPLAAATVTLRLGPEFSEATTDAEGTFHIAWFQDQPGDLEIAHPAAVDLRSPGLELEDDARFVLSPSGSIEGHLTHLPLGLAPGGTRVELWRMAGKRGRDWAAVTAEVDDAGAFAFDDLDPGEYALCAFGEGVAGRYESGVLVGPGQHVRQDLACPAGARLQGTLVGPADLAGGEPPPTDGASVVVSTRDRDLPKVLAEERGAETTARADGSFELEGLAPGAYRVTVTTPWGGRVVRGFDVEQSGELVELEIEVAPPASLAGQVLDAEGEPVAGLLVVAQRRKAGMDLDGLAADTTGAGESVAGQARTDGDGRFLLEQVPAEEPILAIVPPTPAILPAWSDSLVLAPGERREGVVLQLPEGTFVQGRVERASATGSIGEHLEGVRVQARMRQSGREVLLLTTHTEADGTYRLGPLLPRLTRLAFHLDGYLPGSESLELQEGIEHQLDVQLQPAWTLRGRVVDEAGAGVSRIRLTASVLDLDRPKDQRRERTELDPDDRSTHTDEYGRFVLRELPPADWILTPRGGTHDLVDRDPRVVTPSLVESGGELELVVRRRPKAERATLALEVLAVATGLPPQDLVVGGVKGAQVTIDGGRVHVTGLPPEPLRIGLAAADCASTYLDLEFHEGLDLDVGLVLLEPGARVVVDLKGKGGKGLKDAKVRLLPKTPEEGGPVAAGGMVGPKPAPRLDLEHRGNGRYRLDSVPHGAWRLRVTAPGHRSQTLNLDVDRARVQRKVELKPKAKG